MGGNASIGLGSADRHSLGDMRCSEANDRSSEETNRKSLFPADETLHNGALNAGPKSQPKYTEEDTRDTRDIRSAEATRSAGDTKEDIAWINARSRTLHGVGVGHNMELGRSLGEDAMREYQRTEDRRTEDRRTEDAEERRVGVGVGERRFEDGAEVTQVTEEFRYTEDTSLNGVGTKEVGRFWGTEKAKDIRFRKMNYGDITPKQRDAETEME